MRENRLTFRRLHTGEPEPAAMVMANNKIAPRIAEFTDTVEQDDVFLVPQIRNVIG
jgi:hypothetical protein